VPRSTWRTRGSEAEKTTGKVQKIDAKIAAAKKELADKEHALAKKLDAVKQESKDKIEQLEAQKATVTEQSKILLERRIADVRADYQDRIDTLGQALERRKAANTTRPPERRLVPAPMAWREHPRARSSRSVRILHLPASPARLSRRPSATSEPTSHVHLR